MGRPRFRTVLATGRRADDTHKARPPDTRGASPVRWGIMRLMSEINDHAPDCPTCAAAEAARAAGPIPDNLVGDGTAESPYRLEGE